MYHVFESHHHHQPYNSMVYLCFFYCLWAHNLRIIVPQTSKNYVINLMETYSHQFVRCTRITHVWVIRVPKLLIHESTVLSRKYSTYTVYICTVNNVPLHYITLNKINIVLVRVCTSSAWNRNFYKISHSYSILKEFLSSVFKEL